MLTARAASFKNALATRVVVAIHPTPREIDLQRMFWRELRLLGYVAGDDEGQHRQHHGHADDVEHGERDEHRPGAARGGGRRG